MEEEEFEKIYNEVKEKFDAKNAKIVQEEEAKLPEKFIKSLDIKEESKAPKRDRSTGKVAKKKKAKKD